MNVTVRLVRTFAADTPAGGQVELPQDMDHGGIWLSGGRPYSPLRSRR